MKTEPDKRNKIPYDIIVTTHFTIYFTNKEEDDGVEIPKELIKNEVMKLIDNGEYDVQEEPME